MSIIDFLEPEAIGKGDYETSIDIITVLHINICPNRMYAGNPGEAVDQYAITDLLHHRAHYREAYCDIYSNHHGYIVPLTNSNHTTANCYYHSGQYFGIRQTIKYNQEKLP